MKFSCEAKELCQACAEAAKAVSVKSTIPALAGIRMILKNNILSLSGYDLEIGVETKLSVIGEEDGAVVSNSAKVLLAALSKLKGQIEVSAEKEHIQIKSRKGNLEFMGVSVMDYPSIPEFEMENEISGAALKRAFTSVSYCIDENSARAAMAGALLSADKGECEVVGLNGSVMVLCKFEAKLGKTRMIIPKNALKIIGDYAGKCSKIYFSTGNNLASFGDETTRIVTRTISGEFIDYSRIIAPTRGFGKIDVNRQNFSEILELINAICTERDRKAVELDFRADGISIKMATSLGRTENHLSCNCPQEYTAAFNPRFLYEAINHTDAENITLHVGGSAAPMRISDGNGYEAIVMPVRMK